MDYLLNQNSLIIEKKSTGEVVWSGKPFDCPVVKISPLLDEMGCIVLLDYFEFSKSSYRHQGNLIRIGQGGEVLWTAELPQSSDLYVDFKVEGDKLLGNTWNGFSVQIDLGSGRMISAVFTK